MRSKVSPEATPFPPRWQGNHHANRGIEIAHKVMACAPKERVSITATHQGIVAIPPKE